MSNHTEDPIEVPRNGFDEPMLPPPAAPKLMTLRVHDADTGELMETWSDLTNSTLPAPGLLRCELLDGRILLISMAGRDLILTPQ